MTLISQQQPKKNYVVQIALLLFIIFNQSDIIAAYQVTGTTEYQVKAAFLYNFAKFVEWSSEAFADSSAPFIIAILGKDPFKNDLEQVIAGKMIKGRKFLIKRYKKLSQVKYSHILFISSSEKKRLKKILAKIRGLNTLTVGDMKGFARQGGIVNFFIENRRIRFEINILAAEQAHLKISSNLLTLAKIIKPGNDRGLN